MEKASTTLNDLPNDMLQLVASYLDTKSLGFFAASNKSYLQKTLPQLIANYQRKLLDRSNLTVLAGDHSIFCYFGSALYVCGKNDFGQLGLGHTNGCRTLTQVPNLPGNILQVSASSNHTLVLTDQGLFTCGQNQQGQLGLGHTSNIFSLTRVNLSERTKIHKVRAGMDYSLVSTKNKGMLSCGRNQYVHLLGSSEILLPIKATAEMLTQFIESGLHMLEKHEGPLFAWGHCDPPGYGQNNYYDLSEVQTLGGNIQKMIAGKQHILILMDQGLYACGQNSYGQLGLGHRQACTKPQIIPEFSPGSILQVSAGAYHTVVLTTKGLFAWGRNSYGQLGLGNTQNYTTPTILSSPPGIILQVSAGAYHTVVLTTEGIFACGRNDYGQLGTAHVQHCLTFVPVKLQDAIQQNFSLAYKVKQWQKLATLTAETADSDKTVSENNVLRFV